MAEQFDPYYTWLGIPPEDQPPNCYRLLGLRLFEHNSQVIENAANRQMSHLRTFQVGPQSALSQRLLNEVAAAKICLLHPAKKEQYDRRLREAMEEDAEPEFEEPLPNVLAPPPRGSARRGRRVVLGTVVGTVALLLLLAAVLFTLRAMFPSAKGLPVPPESARKTDPHESRKENRPKESAGNPNSGVPREPSPENPAGEESTVPGEIAGGAPDVEPPEIEAATDRVPEGPVEASLSDLFEGARWFHASRPDEGVLVRLQDESETMAVNPSYAILAIAGSGSRPAPARFFAAAKGDAEPVSARLGELVARLNELIRVEGATAVEFGPSGRFVALGGADGSIRVWNLLSEKEVCRFVGDGPAVVGLAFNRLGRVLVSLDAEGKAIRIWNVPEAKPIRSMELDGKVARSLTFFARRDVVVAGLDDGDILAFDVHDDSKKELLHTGRGAVRAIAAARENLILAGTEDGAITVFHPQPRFVLGPFAPGQKPLQGIAVHEQSALGAVCGGDSSVRLWQCTEGRPWGQLVGHEGPVTAVGFSPDGKTVFSLSMDATVRAWKTPTVPDDALTGRVKPLAPDAPVPNSLLPVPDETTVAAVKERLLEPYELSRGRTLPEKQKVAKSLLEAARRVSDTPEDYYVLLEAAARESRDSGDVEGMIEAVNRLGGTFECDAESLTLDMLVECASKVFQREQAAACVFLIEEKVLQLLLDEGRHEDAKRLSVALYALSQKEAGKEFLPRARLLRDKVAQVVDQKKLPLPKRATLAEWRDDRYRAGLLKRFGGTVESERAVQQALQWLAAVQFSDGGWNFDHGLHPERKGKATDTGNRRDARNAATAMALLPFLATGNTHRSGEYKAVVARGLDFLGAAIKPEKVRGRPIGGSLWKGGEMASTHPLGALAFTETLALSGDKRLQPIVQQLAAFSLAAEDTAGGGWNGYQIRRPGDLHVTLSQIRFLFVGGFLTQDVQRRTTRFLDSVQYDGGSRYHPKRDDSAEGSRHDAAGLYLRLLLGCKPDNAALMKGISRFREEGWALEDPETSVTLSQLLFQLGGKDWEDWNQAYLEKVLPEQETEGPEKGSWHYRHYLYGNMGGRLYSTVSVTLVLQTYYRYPRLLEEAK